MKKSWLVVLVTMLGLVPMSSLAQPEEQILAGQVQSVHESGTEMTLADGTMLLTPPGLRFQPGALQAGMFVIAVYWEQENGNKILTRLSVMRRTDPGVRSKSTMRD